MSFYDNSYYYLNKRLLSIIGQWPYQSRLESNTMLGITLFFTGSLTFLEGWGLVSGMTDLSIIMENASPLLVNSLIFVKLINYFFNKYKVRSISVPLRNAKAGRAGRAFRNHKSNEFFKVQMKELLDHVEETWQMIQVGPRNEILRSYAEQTKVYTIRYTLALYAMWVLYSTMPLIVSWTYKLLPINATYTARFLYRLEHVCDVDKYFNLLMLHGFISVFYIVSVPIAVDTMNRQRRRKLMLWDNGYRAWAFNIVLFYYDEEFSLRGCSYDCVLKRAVDEEKEVTSETEFSSSNLTVSGDGTWKKRGFNSRFGVTTLIGKYSNKVPHASG
ncbi:hypothetical protein EAI_13795 [Harpegnathos saltator]|uniref:Odorant receptor n=1 Tax=Harpegnathos saltator TaxID=610380 RepID=E2BXA4_HARSA|nr:hypothetical protein EAI_13795 [Harpegnathos saltator]